MRLQARMEYAGRIASKARWVALQRLVVKDAPDCETWGGGGGGFRIFRCWEGGWRREPSHQSFVGAQCVKAIVQIWGSCEIAKYRLQSAAEPSVSALPTNTSQTPNISKLNSKYPESTRS